VESKNSIIRRLKHCQIALAIFASLSLSLALADNLKTVDGKEYKNATISRADTEGVAVVQPVFLDREQAINYAKGPCPVRLWRDSHSGLRSSETSPQIFRRKVKGGEKGRGYRQREIRFWSILLARSAFHLSIPINSISVSIHLQKKPVVCPQCRSTARIGRDLCLSCMLFLGITASGDTSETLDDLLGEIDVSTPSTLSGNLVRHFP